MRLSSCGRSKLKLPNADGAQCVCLLSKIFLQLTSGQTVNLYQTQLMVMLTNRKQTPVSNLKFKVIIHDDFVLESQAD